LKDGQAVSHCGAIWRANDEKAKKDAMIIYMDSLPGISVSQLQGFFVGWPNPPSPEMHLRLLRSSYAVELALDSQSRQVVGFITAVSDGLLSAYIPFLEVLPSYQHRSVGRELVRRMLEKLGRLYMIDLLCDPELQGFYSRLGMQPAAGMMIRNFEKQAGW
jgi:ribosomal protein S18 acetylase RimI-like enzyme